MVSLVALSLAACVKPVAPTGPGPASLVSNGAANAAPTPQELELILKQTESKGLKAEESLRLPASEHAASPGEVVVRFKDGKTHDLPGATKLRDVGIPGMAVYKTDSGAYDAATLAAWQADSRLLYAEPNYKLKTTAADGPDDPKMSRVWGYYQVRTHKLWLAGYKVSNPIKVGVVDTGVDYNHEDLSGVTVKGLNTVKNNRDPFDDHGHGTHVAGVIGAKENNSGIAGVAAGAQLYAVKALDATGEGPEEDIARGLMDAVNAGCKVVNMSLGGPLDVQALRDAVAEATRRGTLVVVAAGNDGEDDEKHFPASYPDALAVGATMPDDSRAFFSNGGTFVDIAAPGVLIMSTLPDNEYDYLDGTSMAAPHVAGAAALLWSRHPELSVSQVRNLLTSSALPTKGWTKSTVGMVNVRAAFEKLEGKKIGPPDYNGGGSATPPPGPIYTPPPAPPLTQWFQALATAFDLYATEENVRAFMNEVSEYEKNGTLGPGSGQAAAVRDLQRALAKFNYPVTVSGTFDEATGQAVLAYKKANGLHQSYRKGDGYYAVNEYIDPGTFNSMMAKLFSAAVAARQVKPQ
ncbi:MAG: S8 family serine peptidase [Candidatus Sericytochromatia bacterium]|nr:S8 family serine peptidase [Candidatus Tanganyikabacteria bacterium]